MPSDSTDPSALSDEPSTSGHGLRVVKVRLFLTLVAVAILPIAVLAPIFRTILDDPRAAQRERLTIQSDNMASETRRELERIRGTLLDLAISPETEAVLGPEANAKTVAAASAQLAEALGQSSGLIGSVALVDLSGADVTRVGAPSSISGSFVPPRPGTSPFTLVGTDSGQGATIDITVPALRNGAGAPTGFAIASVPLASVLRRLEVDHLSSAQRLSILDQNGQELVGLALNVANSGSDSASIEFTADESTRTTGAADLGIPGLPGWRLVGSSPTTVAVLPLPLIAVLAILIGLLVVFVLFMARQILAPAAALEEQRAHFHNLYLNAREASLQDNLTGLGNHRAFQEALARMVERTRRHGHRFSLVLLDIDEFKRVNDTRGHAVGDELLREVGDLIRASIRGSDAGFRIGGDEFAIVLAEADTAGAEITARRILSRGLDTRPAGQYQGPISFSAGITCAPDLAVTRMELTSQADAALYRGKRAGRTIVAVYDPAIDHGHIDDGMRAELSASISAVIESGGLTSVYQPIVHLPTGRILGYEGLVRIPAASGFPHTGALFDAGEIAGRVIDLDRAALDVVLRGADAIPSETLISVNVSPRSFEAPEFSAATFLAILRRHRMPPERVLLELTERDTIRDPDRLRTAIQALQEAGVRIAADDVGAGNAGLRLLSQFRFDVVKIDLSLVQGGASKDQTMSVLTTLVDMARRWGALTIAEGVETAEQLKMIRELNIDAAQGYLLGRPAADIDPSDLDLDVLSGTTPRPVVVRTPRPVSAQASFKIVPAVPAPVPTAASVLGGNAPSIFGAR